MTDTMPAITLWQPFATLVADGHKTVETRSHDKAAKYVGKRIAIHAAKRKVTDRELMNFPNTIHDALAKYYDGGRWWHEQIPYGAAVATAKLVKVAQVVAHWEDEYASDMAETHDGDSGPIDDFGDFSVGRWLWFLDDIRKLDTPYPATGRQGFWTLELPEELRSSHVQPIQAQPQQDEAPVLQDEGQR